MEPITAFATPATLVEARRRYVRLADAYAAAVVGNATDEALAAYERRLARALDDIRALGGDR